VPEEGMPFSYLVIETQNEHAGRWSSEVRGIWA
jgi:hypothetical protein